MHNCNKFCIGKISKGFKITYKKYVSEIKNINKSSPNSKCCYVGSSLNVIM